jgi:hypothetical protein
MLAAAVALNVAVVVPAVIVTDGGTVSKLLLLASVTLEPPMGATWVSVTVQVLTALCARLVGLQVTPETSTGARRPMLAVWKLPPRIAVTVTLWLLAIELAAVALKAAVVAPAATITEAGTVSQVLLLSSATLDPPVGAAWVSVTVQVLTALCARLVGLQVTPETRTPVSRLMVTVRELLPRVAVKVALWLLAIEAPAVALNVAVVAPAATVTEAGTVSEALLLASVTLDPPVGAVVFKVTVQLATAPGFRLPGLHMRDEMAGTVTIALAPADTVSPLPVASTPTGLFIVIAVVTALAASVNWMLATTPEAIVLVFNPDSRQVNKPDADAQ